MASDQPYEMTLPQYFQVRELAYGENLPAYEEHPWRRHMVEDLYHGLRAQGIDHKQAVLDVRAALPRITQPNTATGAVELS